MRYKVIGELQNLAEADEPKKQHAPEFSHEIRVFWDHPDFLTQIKTGCPMLKHR